MEARELLSEVKRRGVEIRSNETGDRIRLRPGSLLTPELRDELKAHKAEVLALLTGRPGERVTSSAEVFEMAREAFPNRDDLPDVLPRRQRGRDPMTKHDTDKARFFRGDWREAWPQNFRVHRRSGWGAA